jgi:hypothetical protein
VEKTIAPLFKGALYSSESACAGRSSIGFCIKPLLGSKYDGALLAGFSLPDMVSAKLERAEQPL